MANEGGGNMKSRNGIKDGREHYRILESTNNTCTMICPPKSNSALKGSSHNNYNESPTLYERRQAAPFFYAESSRQSDSDSSDSGRSKRAASSSSPESLVDPRLNKHVRVIQLGEKRASSGGSDDGGDQTFSKCMKLAHPVGKGNGDGGKPKKNPFFCGGNGGFRRLSSIEIGDGLTAPTPITPVVIKKDVALPVPSPTFVVAPCAVAKTHPESKSESMPRIDWFQCQPLSEIDLNVIHTWKQIGQKTNISDPIHCDKKVHEELLTLKKKYLALKPAIAQSARSRCNRYENIRNGIFVNRAALKLANIDADLGFTLSEPRNPDGSSAIVGSDILQFVDICAGPGGFSEYMLYKKRFESKGFGITLRNTDTDLNVRNIQAGPSECYEVYYGKNNDGNINDPANVRSFVQLVQRTTENSGVQLALADGGFDVKGRELEQENLYKQLYVSEFLIALQVLRENGTFVCKLFDTYTAFCVELMYLVHLCFDEITIYKPRMSRSQNTEKYLICRGKRLNIEHIIRYLSECHQLLWEYSTDTTGKLSSWDLVGLVPAKIWKSKHAKPIALRFLEKIKDWNTRLANIQIVGIKLALTFANDRTMEDEHREESAKKCYIDWHLPIGEDGHILQRIEPRIVDEMTYDTYDRLWKEPIDVNQLEERVLKASDYESIFTSPYDWRVIVVQGNGTTYRETRGFYLSQGGTDIFRYNMKTKEWEETSITFELPKDTILYGECVHEFTGRAHKAKAYRAFHIIDALIIDGRNVRDLHYITRHEICSKLAKSVNKSSRGDLQLVRVKQLVRMENMADLLDKCEKRMLPGDSAEHWTCPIDHTDETSPILSAAGIMFLKLTKDPWMMALSKSSRRKYWFNTSNNESTFTIPPSAVSTFINTMQTRTIWRWSSNTNLDVPEDFEEKSVAEVLLPPPQPSQPEAVHSAHLLKHLCRFRPGVNTPQ